jgi:hypothetical protein
VGVEEERGIDRFGGEETIGGMAVVLEQAADVRVLRYRERVPLGQRQRDVVGVVDLEHRGLGARSTIRTCAGAWHRHFGDTEAAPPLLGIPSHEGPEVRLHS